MTSETCKLSAPPHPPFPKTKGKKPFTSKQRSRWLPESTLTVSLVILLPRAIAIQVPHRTHAACRWSAHMTNYYWAYYQKSALVGGSGWGRWEGVRGVREEQRVCWGFQQSLPSIRRQRRGTNVSPLLTSKKEFISITNDSR